MKLSLIIFGMAIIVLSRLAIAAGIIYPSIANYLFFYSIGVCLVLLGSYMWVKEKNRNTAFVLFGFLVPIGIIFLALLKSKKDTISPKELEKEARTLERERIEMNGKGIRQ